MKSTLTKSFAAALTAFLLAGTGWAQDKETPKPDKQDPAIKEKCKELDDAVGDRKFEHDSEAVTMINDLLGKYESMHEKDQKLFRDSLQKVFSAKLRKPENPGLYRAAVYALGQIGGPEAAAILARQLSNSSHFDEPEWRTLQTEIIENLGKTKDPKQVSTLLDLATNSPYDPIKAAGGKALRYYEGLPLDKRQEIYKKLLVDYEKIYGDAMSVSEPGSNTVQTRKRTLATIQDPWNGTLGQLSGQACGTAIEWRKWYNDHKDDKKAWK